MDNQVSKNNMPPAGTPSPMGTPQGDNTNQNNADLATITKLSSACFNRGVQTDDVVRAARLGCVKAGDDGVGAESK